MFIFVALVLMSRLFSHIKHEGGHILSVCA